MNLHIIAIAWALHFLPLRNFPANNGKTVRVSTEQCEWKNNTVKKINLAINAIEHWDIYLTVVITTCCLNYWMARKWYNHFPFTCTPSPFWNINLHLSHPPPQKKYFNKFHLQPNPLKHIFDKLRLFTYQKLQQFMRFFGSYQIWCSRVAIQPFHIVKFLVIFNLCIPFSLCTISYTTKHS